MMRTYTKGLWMIIGLITLTGVALALNQPRNLPDPSRQEATDGRVTLNSQLMQQKVLKGSDGRVTVELTLAAGPDLADEQRPRQIVDLVVVLDRSGSMEGPKLEAARQTLLRLLDRLGPEDRLSLVTYADNVQVEVPLTTVDPEHRMRWASQINHVSAEGSTNLGEGLRTGIDLLRQTQAGQRQRKLILISDGLANQGVTAPLALGQMAASAREARIAVSTVGVGLDFNELLMTTIADQGAGRYHFLEDPLTFAAVIETELRDTRNLAVSALELRVPLADGIQLVAAGGYPVALQDGCAVVHPGQLLAGQARKFFLTFQVPTAGAKSITLPVIQLRYERDGVSHVVSGPAGQTVACVADEKEVVASFDKKIWSSRVIQEEYNQLKETVADAIRKGDPQQAQARIQDYESRQKALNATLASPAVTANLEHEVKALRETVADVFSGSGEAVAAKQKLKAKVLQYESYQQRRATE